MTFLDTLVDFYARKSSAGQSSFFGSWKEQDHPRDDDGKFAEKGGGTATMADEPFSLTRQSVREGGFKKGKGKDTQRALFEGLGDKPGQTSIFDKPEKPKPSRLDELAITGSGVVNVTPVKAAESDDDDPELLKLVNLTPDRRDIADTIRASSTFGLVSRVIGKHAAGRFFELRANGVSKMAALVDVMKWDDKGPDDKPDKPKNGKAHLEAKPPKMTEAEALEHSEDYRTNKVKAKAFKQWFGDWENDAANASKVVNKKGEPQEQYPVAKVFHGTRYNFEKFDPSSIGSNGLVVGKGFYFAENKRVAETYHWKGEGQMVEAYLCVKKPFDFDDEFPEAEAFELLDKIVAARRVGDYAKQEYRRELRFRLTESTLWQTGEPGKTRATINGFGIWKALRGQFGREVVNETLESIGYDGITHLSKDLGGTPANGNTRPPKPSAFDPPEETYGRVWMVFKPTQIKSVDNQGTFDPHDPRFRYGADWDESKHPRGQPDNAGQFAPASAGGGSPASKSEPPSTGRPPGMHLDLYEQLQFDFEDRPEAEQADYDPKTHPQTDEEIAACQKVIADGKEFFGKLVDENAKELPKAVQKGYRETFNQCLEMMTAPMVEAITKTVGGAKFYDSLEKLTYNLAWEKVIWNPKYTIGGAFGYYPTDRTGTLFLDGDSIAFNLDQRGIYAHELGHALDFKDRHSNSEEWRAAWTKEINQPSAPLSKYAMERRNEGLAEYFRLMNTNPKAARTDFPDCWACFKKWGYL